MIFRVVGSINNDAIDKLLPFKIFEEASNSSREEVVLGLLILIKTKVLI
jgi:hypothetical protein